MLNSKHESADKIYLITEKIGYKFFSKFFCKLPFSPNQITLINFFINNIPSAIFFSLGKYWANIVAILFIVSATIWDWMDGVVARTKKLSSKGGAFLDPALDYIMHKMMVAGIAIGVYVSSGSNFIWLIVGFLALVSLTTSNYFGDLFENQFGFGFRGDYEDFCKFIDNSKKANLFDKFSLEILTYRKFIYIFFFTIRYPLLLGALTNQMKYFLLFVVITSLIRSILLFNIYFFFLEAKGKKKNLIIIEALQDRYHYWQNEKYKNYKK